MNLTGAAGTCMIMTLIIRAKSTKAMAMFRDEDLKREEKTKVTV